MSNLKKAYIAGGCFWGMEDLFRKRPGIKDTEVIYLGGKNENPTYQNHPGHAEGIELTYDTNETSFKEILDEDEFFNTIQSLNQMKFGIAPDQLLNSISVLSQALTNDANGYGANYAELVMTFNKNESITDRVKSLFKKAINQKSSFKKIG